MCTGWLNTVMTVPLFIGTLVPSLFFCMWRGKIVWSTAYSTFVPSGTPIRLLHENYVIYCNESWPKKVRWLTILCRRLSQVEPENEPAKNPSTSMNARCVFLSLPTAVWSSWASDVDKTVLGLSEVDRGFKFCKSSFLGIQKLQEGWSLQRAVFLELFRSFRLCVTFLKMLRH